VVAAGKGDGCCCCCCCCCWFLLGWSCYLPFCSRRYPSGGGCSREMMMMMIQSITTRVWASQINFRISGRALWSLLLLHHHLILLLVVMGTTSRELDDHLLNQCSQFEQNNCKKRCRVVPPAANPQGKWSIFILLLLWDSFSSLLPPSSFFVSSFCAAEYPIVSSSLALLPSPPHPKPSFFKVWFLLKLPRYYGIQHCVHMSHPSCDDALLWRVEYDFC